MLRADARRGITLIELLVAIAIVGILVALLLPAVLHAREAARRAQCQNNLRQVALAVHSYHDHSGSFPPATVVDGRGFGWWSWLARVLPDLEQRPLYEQIDFRDDVWTHCHVYRPVTSQRLSVLHCPSDPHSRRVYESFDVVPEGEAYALTSYLGCRGSTRPQPGADGIYPAEIRGNGAFPGINQTVRLADILDGTSQTILVGERPADPAAYLGWWAAGMGIDEQGLGDYLLDVADGLKPGDLPDGTGLLHYWSRHPGGAHFAHCDGSVRFVLYSIERHVLLAIGSRDGAEVVAE